MKKELISKFDKDKVCENKQGYDYDKLEYIIVGDNPGKEEKKQERYFVGTSGKQLRQFFENEIIFGKKFDDSCIVFNKTFIHTIKTEDLKKIRANDTILFNEVLVCCAKEIIKLSNEKNLPILIFGKTHLKPNSIFEPFWKEINKSVGNKEIVLVYNHPSYNNFNKEWKKYKEQYPTSDNKELLIKIGTENTKTINNLYPKK